jgi:hypothetical protein
MATRLSDRADQSLSRRKARDRAMILPLAGLILLTPPVAEIFHLDAKISGVPFTLVYVFAVWALLIAGAAALARRLRAGEETSAGQSGGEAGMPELDTRQDPVA